MYYNFRIDIEDLDRQINDVLESDMPERSKTGLHNLLGEIRDQTEQITDVEYPIISITADTLYDLYDADDRECRYIDRLNTHDMVKLSRAITRQLMASAESASIIKKTIKQTFEKKHVSRYLYEIPKAVDGLEHLWNETPLNGDEIEELVEEFKRELQERNGDLP